MKKNREIPNNTIGGLWWNLFFFAFLSLLIYFGVLPHLAVFKDYFWLCVSGVNPMGLKKPYVLPKIWTQCYMQECLPSCTISNSHDGTISILCKTLNLLSMCVPTKAGKAQNNFSKLFWDAYCSRLCLFIWWDVSAMGLGRWVMTHFWQYLALSNSFNALVWQCWGPPGQP